MKTAAFRVAARAWPAAAILLCCSCNDKRRHAAQEGADFGAASAPVTADSPPGDVARAFFEAAREAQHVRAGGLGSPERKRAYDTAFAKLNSLLAREEIHTAMLNSGSGLLPKDISLQAATTVACEAWISLLGYYIDGVRTSEMKVLQSQGVPRTIVSAVASRPQDDEAVLARTGGSDAATLTPSQREELLRKGINPQTHVRIDVTLVKKAAGWRVSDVEIGPPTSFAVAAPSQPAPPAAAPPPGS